MSLLLKLLAAFSLGLAAVSLTSGQEPPLGLRPGVLMLRNGELVEGEIGLAGDRYDVLAGGGQIHIKRSEVEFVGSTVLECYERRRARTELGKAQECLELAEWCLRHKLYEQAALSLADAVDADAQHPRIALIERRLKFALERPASSTAPSTAAAEPASARDLDRLVNGLPLGAVETFTTSIQPVLLNHCSTAGCHGPQSSTSLKLMRIPAGRTPSRRATQRNLYAVLSAIDREHPSDSPLLTVPTRPHGAAKSAIFTTHEANQYKQLARWVYQIASQPPPAGLAAAPETIPAAHRSDRRPHGRRREPRAIAARPTDTVEPKPATTVRHWPGQAPPQAADATDDGPVAGDDAFDPEVFNRQYLPAAKD